jgi:hypothetical protein
MMIEAFEIGVGLIGLALFAAYALDAYRNG